MGQDISDIDFVNSFLRAAQERNIAAIVVYGTTALGRAQLRLVSNAGEGPTQGLLSWLRSAQPNVDPMADPPAPASEPS